jgi:hypothetical protein
MAPYETPFFRNRTWPPSSSVRAYRSHCTGHELDSSLHREFQNEPVATCSTKPEINRCPSRFFPADHRGHIAAGFFWVPNLIREKPPFVEIAKLCTAVRISAFSDQEPAPLRKTVLCQLSGNVGANAMSCLYCAPIICTDRQQGQQQGQTIRKEKDTFSSR